MAGKLTAKKARQILHDKEVHGHPLTEKQRRFFGAISGGAKPYEYGGEIDTNFAQRAKNILANGGSLSKEELLAQLDNLRREQFSYEQRFARGGELSLKKEIENGVKVEMEHADSLQMISDKEEMPTAEEFARLIATDHIKDYKKDHKSGSYYKKLIESGLTDEAKKYALGGSIAPTEVTDDQLNAIRQYMAGGNLISGGTPMDSTNRYAMQDNQYKSGGTIHIKPENRGKFTATKERTGKTTEELTHSKNPLTRKRAIFAQNARKWKHEDGGELLTSGGASLGGQYNLPSVTPSMHAFGDNLGVPQFVFSPQYAFGGTVPMKPGRIYGAGVNSYAEGGDGLQFDPNDPRYKAYVEGTATPDTSIMSTENMLNPNTPGSWIYPDKSTWMSRLRNKYYDLNPAQRAFVDMTGAKATTDYLSGDGTSPFETMGGIIPSRMVGAGAKYAKNAMSYNAQRGKEMYGKLFGKSGNIARETSTARPANNEFLFQQNVTKPRNASQMSYIKPEAPNSYAGLEGTLGDIAGYQFPNIWGSNYIGAGLGAGVLGTIGYNAYRNKNLANGSLGANITNQSSSVDYGEENIAPTGQQNNNVKSLAVQPVQNGVPNTKQASIDKIVKPNSNTTGLVADTSGVKADQTQSTTRGNVPPMQMLNPIGKANEPIKLAAGPQGWDTSREPRTNWMQYAPAAFNLLAGIGARRGATMPTNITGQTISPQLIAAEQLSTAPIQRQSEQQYASAVNALSGMTGGSGAAMRAGLAGFSLPTDQLSEIYARNAALRGEATKFNALSAGDAAKFNAQQAAEAQRINLQNQMANIGMENAFRQRRLGSLAAATENLGQIAAKKIEDKRQDQLEKDRIAMLERVFKTKPSGEASNRRKGGYLRFK